MFVIALHVNTKNDDKITDNNSPTSKNNSIVCNSGLLTTEVVKE